MYVVVFHAKIVPETISEAWGRDGGHALRQIPLAGILHNVMYVMYLNNTYIIQAAGPIQNCFLWAWTNHIVPQRSWCTLYSYFWIDWLCLFSYEGYKIAQERSCLLSELVLASHVWIKHNQNSFHTTTAYILISENLGVITGSFAIVSLID